ncbi:SDR family NAD(P)-dependent oxidoreductase [Candidatus Magnetomonas plexicatena]|uniref:SDR family NAD(P)-dependent oxidoreductase n=1 Tax=Candidatus Magnetomonas plexicatena TaxID=2552947 RepID=UPI001C78A873|nr:hypothetical protein E2O03_006180 [Nitrospirales bacterium LBB_01]
MRLGMIFTLEDQLLFAKLSGDYNPLHIEPLFARRLPYGGVVVHGIAALLWALDEWLSPQTGFLELVSLKVNFRKPIVINQNIHWRVTRSDDTSVSIVLEADGANHVEIKAAFLIKIDKHISNKLPSSQKDEIALPRGDAPEPLWGFAMTAWGLSSDDRECRVVTKEEIVNCSGNIELYLDYALYEELFPNLYQKASDIQAAQIIATSRLVGMRCPGYHSLYSGCELSFSETTAAAAETLSYRVTGYDKNFSRCKIFLEGSGVSGTLIAFYRPESYQQPDVAGVVSPDEFKDQRALIIGGSRGLGEVTAKILAAGGADVQITYHRGIEDAERVIEKIATGRAVQFDVLHAAFPADFAFAPTHLYYFATPAIFVGTKNVFSAGLFQRFCDYYVTGFINTVKTLLSADIPLKVFYPSSVALDEIQPNMGEYTAAKAAGESVCRFLEKTNKNLKIHAARLPRLATDQTVDIRTNLNQDPFPFMLEELKRFNRL